MAWAMPVPELSMAMPASAAAICIPPRASRSSGASTARPRWRTTSRIACRQTESFIRLARRMVAASMAWTSASTPVAAVSSGGRPTVSVGSRSARSALSSSPQAQTFSPLALVNTETRVVSDPVPAVVGRQILARPCLGSGFTAKA